MRPHTCARAHYTFLLLARKDKQSARLFAIWGTLLSHATSNNVARVLIPHGILFRTLHLCYVVFVTLKHKQESTAWWSDILNRSSRFQKKEEILLMNYKVSSISELNIFQEI